MGDMEWIKEALSRIEAKVNAQCDYCRRLSTDYMARLAKAEAYLEGLRQKPPATRAWIAIIVSVAMLGAAVVNLTLR